MEKFSDAYIYSHSKWVEYKYTRENMGAFEFETFQNSSEIM